MQVHENCVNAGGVKEKRKERWKEIILSKIPFHLRQCCRKRTDRAEPIFLNFSLNSSLFCLAFFPYLPPLSFWPSLILKVEWKPFISHQTRFMTAAALHSCWMVCLKGFLTRPWIRLVASHSLFLSAWLDSDADISWTLTQSPDHPTHTRLLFCAASKAAKTA